jgi:tight adherence protein B
MFLVLFVFLFVTGLIVGGYIAATRLPGLMAERKLERRLEEVISGPPSAEATPAGDSTVVRKAETGPLPALDRLLSNGVAGSWLTRLIERSGVKTTPSAVAVISLGCGGGAAFITLLFVHYAIAPIAAGAIAAFLPIAFLMRKKTVRLRKFEEQFPEALDLLSRAIRAGHAFQTAMGMAADELSAPVGPEFKKTFDQQNFGLPLKDSLNQFADRVGILDVRFFVTAVLIQRETGGNLSEILDNLAHVVRERFKIMRQVRVHTAHGRFTGYVLLALPAGLAIALSIINADHMRPLFQERMGQMMLMVAVGLQIFGYLWIRKIIKIEV